MRNWLAIKLFKLARKLSPQSFYSQSCIDVNAEIKKLNAEFKNWEKTVRSAGFGIWPQDQDDEIQRCATSSLAEDAAKVLRKYKSQLRVIK